MRSNKTMAKFISEVNSLDKQQQPLMQATLVVWNALPSKDKEIIANRARQLTSIRNCGSGTALEIYAALCAKIYQEAKLKNEMIIEQQFGALIYDARNNS